MRRLLGGLVIAALALFPATGCGRRAPDVYFAARTPPYPGGARSRPATALVESRSKDASLAPPGVHPLPWGRHQLLGTVLYGTFRGSKPAYWIAAEYPWEHRRRPRLLARVAGSDEEMYDLLSWYVTTDGVVDPKSEMLGRVPPDFKVMSAWGLLGEHPRRWDAGQVTTDYRTARVEKPVQLQRSGGESRVVGVLAYWPSFRGVRTERWAVTNSFIVPPGGTAKPLAFLEELPRGFDGTGYPYVEVEGEWVDAVGVSGTPWPVVRVTRMSRVATGFPAP